MPYNLIRVCVWLAAGSVLTYINVTGKPVYSFSPGLYTMTMAAFAYVLAGYFAARWGASRALAKRKTEIPAPPKKRIIEGQQLEYNPEFDFTANTDKSQPKG
jgi:hypothetical protein